MFKSDTEEICELMYSYCWLIDAGDLDGVCELMRDADIYNEGRLVLKRNPKLYRRYFLDGMIIYPDGTPKTTHMCVNPVISIAGDGVHAEGKSTTVVLQGIDGEFTPRIVWIDRKLDTFVKEDGHWKFRTRNFVTVSKGDTSAHLKQK